MSHSCHVDVLHSAREISQQKLDISARFVLIVSVAPTSLVHVATMLVVIGKLKITKLGLPLMTYQYCSYKLNENLLIENVIRKDKKNGIP
jgi:hypothetical protein